MVLFMHQLKLESIETCFYHNIPVIVSTDNKLDQQEQLFCRIQKDLKYSDVTLLKTSDANFSTILETCIKTKNNRFIIFCLDNCAQIRMVSEKLSHLYLRFSKLDNIKKLQLYTMKLIILQKIKL